MSEINEQIQKHNELIKANIYNSFEKGGEGSKGGKIIGHTKSGKPIYDTGAHSSYKDFTSEDHADAAEAHHKEFSEEYDKNISDHVKSGKSKRDYRIGYKEQHHKAKYENHLKWSKENN